MSISEIEERRAAIEERRAARRLALQKAKEGQLLKDMAALDVLEEEHGMDSVECIHLSRWREGVATMIIIRFPEAKDHKFKRFQSQANSEKANASAKVAAAELLGQSCMVYPSKETDPDLYQATLDFAPGILGHAAQLIVETVQGQVELEGK